MENELGCYTSKVNVLLVDYESIYTDRVIDLLVGCAVKKISWQGNLLSAANDVDAVNLSGGHQFSVANNDSLYSSSFELITHTTKPLLGICLGCQLLAYAYGAKLKRLPIRAKGLVTINSTSQSPLLRNIQQFESYENHRWSISQVAYPIVPMARSKFGIEVIQHRVLPHFGVQFHPEMLPALTPGRAIMANFMRLVSV